MYCMGAGAAPPAGGVAPAGGVQRSISLEYQICPSRHTIWFSSSGNGSERRGAPPTHILVNKPILQHFDILVLAFYQPPKRAVVGLLGHHGWPFYTEDTFYWLYIHCKQNVLLKFVDIKIIQKDKKKSLFNCHWYFNTGTWGRQHCRLRICEYWLSWTNTVSVSEQKIPITILILERGPCLTWGHLHSICQPGICKLLLQLKDMLELLVKSKLVPYKRKYAIWPSSIF